MERNPIFELGRYTGKMHSLTKSYKLSNPRFKRQEWDEEEQLKLRKYVPEDQTKVFQQADDLMNELRQLPKNVTATALFTQIFTMVILTGIMGRSLHLILMISGTTGL